MNTTRTQHSRSRGTARIKSREANVPRPLRSSLPTLHERFRQHTFLSPLEREIQVGHPTAFCRFRRGCRPAVHGARGVGVGTGAYPGGIGESPVLPFQDFFQGVRVPGALSLFPDPWRGAPLIFVLFQDMDLTHERRHLICAGRLFRTNSTFERKGIYELFVLLFDNYRAYKTVLSPL